jgi:hypothetical protein
VRTIDVRQTPVGLALAVFGAFDMDNEIIATVTVFVLPYDMDFDRAFFREYFRVQHHANSLRLTLLFFILS